MLLHQNLKKKGGKIMKVRFFLTAVAVVMLPLLSGCTVVIRESPYRHHHTAEVWCGHCHSYGCGYHHHRSYYRTVVVERNYSSNHHHTQYAPAAPRRVQTTNGWSSEITRRKRVSRTVRQAPDRRTVRSRSTATERVEERTTRRTKRRR